MTSITYSLSKPVSQTQSWVKDLLIILGASAIISLFAHVRIALPFTPVPLATQGSVILFLAAFLGSKRATFAVLVFIAQGALGLPVFSGGNLGLSYMMGPTGGYILGYVFGAFITGFLVEKMRQKTSGSLFTAMALGNMIQYLFGASWLALFVGMNSAFLLGVVPFIAGDFLKIVISLRGLKTLNFF